VYFNARLRAVYQSRVPHEQRTECNGGSTAKHELIDDERVEKHAGG